MLHQLEYNVARFIRTCLSDPSSLQKLIIRPISSDQLLKSRISNRQSLACENNYFYKMKKKKKLLHVLCRKQRNTLKNIRAISRDFRGVCNTIHPKQARGFSRFCPNIYCITWQIERLHANQDTRNKLILRTSFCKTQVERFYTTIRSRLARKKFSPLRRKQFF